MNSFSMKANRHSTRKRASGMTRKGVLNAGQPKNSRGITADMAAATTGAAAEATALAEGGNKKGPTQEMINLEGRPFLFQLKCLFSFIINYDFLTFITAICSCG